MNHEFHSIDIGRSGLFSYVPVFANGEGGKEPLGREALHDVISVLHDNGNENPAKRLNTH